MIAGLGNLLVDALEARVPEWAVGKPVKTKDSQEKAWKSFDDEEKLPRRYCVMDVSDSKRDKSTEGTEPTMSRLFTQRVRKIERKHTRQSRLVLETRKLELPSHLDGTKEISSRQFQFRTSLQRLQ